MTALQKKKKKKKSNSKNKITFVIFVILFGLQDLFFSTLFCIALTNTNYFIILILLNIKLQLS
jgi:hypothetical protein